MIAKFGAVAQLGERLHGMEEVAGPIPVSSTKFGSVAQLVEQPAHTRYVEGSIPPTATK